MAWRLDVADVNPLRWPRAVVTSIQRNTLDTTEGVWIGRSGGLGFTFVAPLDVAHWAVSINGDIYEIGVEGPGLSGSCTTRSAGKYSSGTGGTWKVHTEDRIEGRRGQELQWTRLCGNPTVIRTREELLDFARRFEGTPYGVAHQNCQFCVCPCHGPICVWIHKRGQCSCCSWGQSARSSSELRQLVETKHTASPPGAIIRSPCLRAKDKRD